MPTTEDETKFAKMIRVFVGMIQQLEDAAQDVKMMRFIDTAVGAQLDQVGAIATETRQGRSDLVYRQAIRSRIYMNASCGEPERIISAVKQLIKPTRCYYREYYPGIVWVDFKGASAIDEPLKYLQPICSGGVQLILNNIHNSRPFQFDSASGFDYGSLSTLIQQE